MNKQVILHIGTYKTGTTSIQRFLLDNARRMRRQGVAFYRGQFSDENHMELYVATLRYERDSFAKLGICQHIKFDASYTEQVGRRVRRFLRRCHEPSVLFTSEGLSLLRFDDEVERLKSVLNAKESDVKVIVYLRNKADFLRSYTDQLLKVNGRAPSKDPQSALYVEPDTWLTDYDSLVSLYKRGFGAKNVVVLDYDEVMLSERNVIPSFLREIGIDASQWPDATSYFLNTTNKTAARSPKKRWSYRVKRAWNKWRHRRAA